MPPGRSFVPPPVWDQETLERYRQGAISSFIAERAAEGGEGYRAALTANIAAVKALFAATDSLRTFGTGVALVENPKWLDVARYLGGPPVSEDDLNTLAEERIAKRKVLTADLGKRAAEVVEAWIDRDRFPWLFATPRREPTAIECDIAIHWTAGLMTAQQVQTKRRSESAKRQQEAVRRLLLGLGFTSVPRREIDITGGLVPGGFCGEEALVTGTKCDVPIGLRDGRLLLVECKVSNSATNSVKRLNREVGGKAAHWRGDFGQRAITAAVLAGVYKLKNLIDAHSAKDPVILFWEHDLAPLADFLRSAI